MKHRKYAIAHATAHGLAVANEIAWAWADDAVMPERVQHVIAGPSGALPEPGVPCTLVDTGKLLTAPLSWKEAALAGAGADFIVTVADDLWPCKGWDVRLDTFLDMLEWQTGMVDAAKIPMVLVPHDGFRSDLLPTHPIISAAWLAKTGCIFPTEYKHVWCDMDLFCQAVKARALVDCRGALRFDHRHPLKTGIPNPITDAANSEACYADGLAVLDRRHPGWQAVWKKHCNAR